MAVNAHRMIKASDLTSGDKRIFPRQRVALPARLTWKDQRGATRFASVVTCDVSEFGVYVESFSIVPIPLYRLVQFQLEREGRDADMLPASIRGGRVLSAVYRVTQPNTAGRRQGFALRLMVDPKRRVNAAAVPERARAVLAALAPCKPTQDRADPSCANTNDDGGDLPRRKNVQLPFAP